MSCLQGKLLLFGKTPTSCLIEKTDSGLGGNAYCLEAKAPLHISLSQRLKKRTRASFFDTKFTCGKEPACQCRKHGFDLFKLLYIPLKKHYLVFKHMFKQSTIQSSKIILLHVLVRILSQIFLSHPWYYYSKVCYICYKYTMNCTALL